MAAWQPWPVSVRSKMSKAAITASLCTAAVPTGRPGQLCRL